MQLDCFRLAHINCFMFAAGTVFYDSCDQLNVLLLSILAPKQFAIDSLFHSLDKASFIRLVVGRASCKRLTTCSAETLRFSCLLRCKLAINHKCGGMSAMMRSSSIAFTCGLGGFLSNASNGVYSSFVVIIRLIPDRGLEYSCDEFVKVQFWGVFRYST